MRTVSLGFEWILLQCLRYVIDFACAQHELRRPDHSLCPDHHRPGNRLFLLTDRERLLLTHLIIAEQRAEIGFIARAQFFLSMPCTIFSVRYVDCMQYTFIEKSIETARFSE